MEDSKSDTQKVEDDAELAEYTATELSSAFEDIVDELQCSGEISDTTYQRAVFALRSGKNVIQQSKD